MRRSVILASLGVLLLAYLGDAGLGETLNAAAQRYGPDSILLGVTLARVGIMAAILVPARPILAGPRTRGAGAVLLVLGAVFALWPILLGPLPGFEGLLSAAYRSPSQLLPWSAVAIAALGGLSLGWPTDARSADDIRGYREPSFRAALILFVAVIAAVTLIYLAFAATYQP